MGAKNSTPQTAHISNPSRSTPAIEVTPSVISRLHNAQQQLSETAEPAQTKNEHIHCARCCACGCFNDKDKEASLLATKANELEESQYVKALEKLDAMLGKPIRFADVNSDQLRKLQHKLVKCYGDNPRQPLVCSDAAKEYQNFVFKQQFNAILSAKNITPQGEQ